MRKHIMMIAFAVSFLTLAGAGVASAQEGGGGGGGGTAKEGGAAPGNIGVGVERSLSGLKAAAFVYDAGKFHIDVLLGFVSGDDNNGNNDFTAIGLGGRFFYHVATSERADFSVGGGLVLAFYNDDDPDNDDTDVIIEVAAKIRAFLVPNVAFTGQLGLVFDPDNDGTFLLGDNNVDIDVALGGVAGSFGMIYFF